MCDCEIVPTVYIGMYVCMYVCMYVFFVSWY